MTLSPQQLKEKLLKTLDSQYNVTDMVGAVELLSVLEIYPVTKEILEKTRIGLYVNEMRKKTSNKDFAKRIKNLLRQWQNLCKPSTQTLETVTMETVSCINRKGSVNSRLLEGHPHLKSIANIRPASPASRSETPCSIRLSISSPKSTNGTPVLATSGRRDGTEVNSCFGVSRCGSEIPFSVQCLDVSSSVCLTTLESRHRPLSTKLRSAPTTPVNGSNLTTSGQGQGSMENGTEYLTSGKRKREDDSCVSVIKIKIRKNSAVGGDTQLNNCLSVAGSDTSCCTPDTVQKPNVNGSLGVYPDHQTTSVSLVDAAAQDFVPLKPQRGRPRNSAKVRAVLDRTSSPVSAQSATSFSQVDSMAPSRLDLASLPGYNLKVETTAAIIQKLHASGELRLVASDTVKNIVSNRIVKETHSGGESVIPAAAKPRPRKKNSVAMPPTTPEMMTMSQIKHEMVHQFLETSVQSSPAFYDNTLNFLKYLDPPPPDPGALIDPDELTEAQAPLPATNPTVANETENDALETPPSLLPPVDSMRIDWNSLEYEASDPSSRTRLADIDIERLHVSQLPGINGQYDCENRWVDWTRTYSVPSYNGELLHVLPYVNITD